MGDAQRLSADEQITLAREQFEDGTDLTLAVEEEFAVLDPSTLGLVGRFEELQAAARGTAARAASRRRADLLGSRGPDRALRDVRGGCCEARRAASSAARARRLARHRARRDRGASLEPVAGAEHHRHAALPVERRAAPLRRVAEQHVRHPRPRRDPRSRPGGGSLQQAPHVPPGPARAVGQLAVRRGRVHVPAFRAQRRSSPACSRAAAFLTRSRAGRSTRASCASSTGRAR